MYRRFHGKHTGKADILGDIYGEHYIVHLRFGHGNGVSPWVMGERSRQRGDIQNDFTGIQHPNRRHDWIPEWYQANGQRAKQTEGENK